MLERALSLRAPELVRSNLNHTKAIGFFSHADHVMAPVLHGLCDRMCRCYRCHPVANSHLAILASPPNCPSQQFGALPAIAATSNASKLGRGVPVMRRRLCFMTARGR